MIIVLFVPQIIMCMDKYEEKDWEDKYTENMMSGHNAFDSGYLDAALKFYETAYGIANQILTDDKKADYAVAFRCSVFMVKFKYITHYDSRMKDYENDPSTGYESAVNFNNYLSMIIVEEELLSSDFNKHKEAKEIVDEVLLFKEKVVKFINKQFAKAKKQEEKDEKKEEEKRETENSDLLKQADQCYNDKNYHSAALAYDEVIKSNLDIKDFNIYKKAGLSHYYLSQNDEAVACFDNYILKIPPETAATDDKFISWINIYKEKVDKQKQEEALKAQDEEKKAQNEENNKHWFQNNMWWIVVAGLVVASLIATSVSGQNKSQASN